MKHLIVANWKMHFNPHQTEIFAHKLNKLDVPTSVTAVICPPFLDIQTASRSLDAKKFKIGAQNCHYVDEGAFTGEVSATMLKGLADYVIIGHSERRAMGERDDVIAAKMAAAVRSGLKPILCVGELLDDRHDGHSTRVVLDQLSANLANLTASEVLDVAIAYEPVWAIGTGEAATPADIEPIVAAIRSTVEGMYGEDAAKIHVLYGGSVEPDTTATIMAVPGVTGLLIGGASLIAPKFEGILEAVSPK